MMKRFTDRDHQTWATLLERQRRILEGRGCDALLHADLPLPPERIPSLDELNPVLQARTRWSLTPVDGLLSDADFFAHLAARTFPVTEWIRTPEQLDYLEEPDLFHDLFGHVPLLMQPAFARLMEQFGHAGVAAAEASPGALQCLTRLYWFTVEFGLVATHDGLRLYGAGIASSKEESIYCVESPIPNRLVFSAERAMITEYRLDAVQQTYFVIDDFEQLDALLADRLVERCLEGAAKPTIPAGLVIHGDRRLEQVARHSTEFFFESDAAPLLGAPGW